MSMIKFLSYIVGMIGTVFTGGKYGSAVPSEHSYNYEKSQERRRKDFAEHGGHPCKICETRIPANKSYCGSCFFRYVKK